jgi:hypothetical protein
MRFAAEWRSFNSNGGEKYVFRGNISTAGTNDRELNSTTVPPNASALIRAADVDRPRVRPV